MLRGEAPFALREDVVNAKARRTRRGRAEPGDADAALLAALKALRGAIAAAQKQPAYVIFPDRTLIEMAKARPADARRSRRRFTASAPSSCRNTARPSSPSSGTIRDRMPELPEVETVRRGLEPAMVGARIEKVELRRGDMRFPFPPRFAERLTGRRIVALGAPRQISARSALDSGETLIVHLGMSGSFRIERARDRDAGRFPPRALEGPEARPCRARISITARASSTTIRAASASWIWSSGDVAREPSAAQRARRRAAGAGISTPRGWRRCFAGSRAPLKAALLDQKRIAGLGNIYVCEALFRAAPLAVAAGRRPRQRARPPDARRAWHWRSAIREVLEEAIEAGGSTLRDHRQTDGDLGYFQHAFAVYDREGAACPRPRCRGTIARMTQSGRSTFYCPVCQK